MSSQANTKNIQEETEIEKSFRREIEIFINRGLATESKDQKCDSIAKVYTVITTQTFWVGMPKYSKFQSIVVRKSYELFKQLYEFSKHNVNKVTSDKITECQELLDKALLICCCNKEVNGRCCKIKKRSDSDYCTFHNNKKTQISKFVMDAINPYLIDDLSNIVLSYVSP